MTAGMSTTLARAWTASAHSGARVWISTCAAVVVGLVVARLAAGLRAFVVGRSLVVGIG